MGRSSRAFAAFPCVLLPLLCAAADVPVPQGLFRDDPHRGATPAQIQKGQQAYTTSCLHCHGGALEGTPLAPALRGEAFEARWRDRSWSEFSAQLRRTMPPGGIGSLAHETLLDIESFISSRNVAARTAPPRVARPARLPPDAGQQKAEHSRQARLAALPVVHEALLRDPPPADWLNWRRTDDATGFSPLKQINRRNVARLRMGWSWSLPEASNEMTPLVHAGVMFVYSGAVVQALDARNGELLWQYVRTLPAHANGGRSARAKSLAISGERLFVPTADGHVIALDMRSGKPLWEQPVVPKPAGTDMAAMAGLPSLNSGAMVVNDTVIIGVSLGLSYQGGCYIVGLDVATGHERWRFHTLARPGSPGGDTWNDAPVEERFGGGIWTAGSYDAALDLVYFGIANTYTAATLLEPRPGASAVTRNDGLYTNATVALRPSTGELVWHYQHQRRDVWDQDWAFEQTLTDLEWQGRKRRVVVTAGKGAIFDAVDAATGEYLFSRDMGLQNQIIAIDPVSGEKTTDPAFELQAGQRRFMCPSSYGARNWAASAMNPASGTVFLPMVENCADYHYAPRSPADSARGGRDVHVTQQRRPDSDGNFGRLAALDLRSREMRWTHRQRMPFASSALATAGSLLFIGDLDRWFYAFDQQDGRVLWRTRLPASPDSFPISYAVDGKQYVAVVAGGGSALSANNRALVPEVAPAAAGVTVVVFELP